MRKKVFLKLIAATLSAAMVLTQIPVSTVVQAKESGITAIGKQTNLVTDRYTSSGVASTLYAKDGGDIKSLADAAIAENLSLTGTGTATGGSESNIAPGSAYSVATAFDPDGDGIEDWIARVSLEDEEKGGKVLLSVSMAAAGDGSGKPYVAFLNNDTGGYITTTDDIPARAVEGLMNIAAGDFDGDGKEELAVYAPNNSDEVETQVADAEGNYPKNQLSIKIYDMDFNLDITNYWNFHVKTSIPEPTKVIEAGEGTTRWNYSSTDATTGDKNFYNIPYLSLMAEDVDGDGIDDLTTVANFSRLKDGYYRSAGLLTLAQVEESLFSNYCLASVMDIYTGSKSVSEFMTQTLKKKVLMGYDAAVNKMFAVRNATVALGSVSDSNSREIMIAGNYSAAYDPSNTNTVNFGIASSRALSVYTEKNGFIWGTGIDIVRPYVVLGCFTYEELVGKEINSFETLKNWDWTYTESGYDRLRFENTTTAEGMEIEPVAMVPFAAHGTDEPDSVFLEGQVFRYNTGTKEFEDTGYAPAYPTNYYSSEGVWIGSAVAGNVTGSADGAETVYYTYYEEDAAGTANYCSIVGLWGEEADGSKTYNSAVKSNSTAAFPMHVALALPEAAATADATTAEIAFAEGELEEDGSIYLVEGGCTPKVVVTYNSRPLRPGEDYYVTYEDNTKAGTATVTITGMGDYTGTGTLNFEIMAEEDEGEDGKTEDDNTEDDGEITYEIKDIETIHADNRTWDSYASYYYYNQLDEAGKAFWKELDAVCKKLLTTTEDATVLGGEYYYTDAVLTNQLSAETAVKIVAQFMDSNPQYYFITNYYSMYPTENVEVGTNIRVRLEVYESFADGEARQKATTFVEQKLAEYYEEIDVCESDEEKVRKMHDLILENTEYESGITIYDVLSTGKAQCEGYTDLFQVLASGAGISSIIVADSDTFNHAWNMVRLNGSWYIIDTTWDDPVDGDGRLYYAYYLVSDKVHGSLNQYVDDVYQPIPEATLSTNPGAYAPGSLQAAEGTTSAPKIKVEIASDSAIVTLSAKDTETIYYTLDGTTPGVTRGASTIYTEPITIKQSCVIKAVAVRDGYVESKVSVQTIEGIEEKEYSITYELAGGTNNSSNPDSYKMSDATITLADPEQTGYYFDGWYTDAEYTAESKVTTIPSGSEGNITLYAKWTPFIYHVSFDANGGEGTMNKISNCEFGKVYTFPANQFTRDGYTFVGWSSYSNGSGTIYKDQSEFSDLFARNNITIKMYAIWEKEGTDPTPTPDPTPDPDPTPTPDPTPDPDPVIENIVSSVTLSDTSYTYTGSYIIPTVVVKNTDNEVVESKYYSLNYSGNKDVGTATVKVTFKYAYEGNDSVEKTFTILPKGTQIAKLKPGKKKLTVKVKAQKNQTSGYQIRYSLKKSMKGAKTITLNKNTKVSRTISKLKAKKKYYVQVRTYKKVSGKKYYSSWSKAVSKKTK